jgi:1,4-dihydroxy-2-naphthoyl-CoA hydrolase
LHNAPQIEIRLSVTNEVDFFGAQFSANFALPLPASGRKNKELLLTKRITSFMSLFQTGTTLASLNRLSHNTMVQHLGIEFTQIGEDFLEAKMPVDARTLQPYGLLHGGASVALAETLGSVGASLCIDNETKYCVGLDINANHIRGVRSGYVFGTARPVHIGKSTHVWEIKIKNETGELVCISRITMAIIDKR